MIWPFKKKPPTPRDLRGWNEDWNVGDIAICHNPNWIKSPYNPSPSHGQRFTVSGFHEGLSTGGSITSSLVFREIPHYWHCTGFRKQRPNEAIAHESWRDMLDNPQPVETPQ